jgi:hypothetical protein
MSVPKYLEIKSFGDFYFQGESGKKWKFWGEAAHQEASNSQYCVTLD